MKYLYMYIIKFVTIIVQARQKSVWRERPFIYRRMFNVRDMELKLLHELQVNSDEL